MQIIDLITGAATARFRFPYHTLRQKFIDIAQRGVRRTLGNAAHLLLRRAGEMPPEPGLG